MNHISLIDRGIIAEKCWSTVKTSLRSERGLWGRRVSGYVFMIAIIVMIIMIKNDLNYSRLLRVSPLQGEANVHPFLVDDITATIHPSACVWEEADQVKEQEENQTQLQEEEEQILPENGTILFSDHVLMILPMHHVPGTLTLTHSMLSFVVDTEYITSMKKRMKEVDQKIANGVFQGENKWRVLGLPENYAWPIDQLESEEYRLFEVIM